MKLNYFYLLGVTLCISCQSEQSDFDVGLNTELTPIKEKVIVNTVGNKSPNFIFKVTHAELTNFISGGNKAKSRSGENNICSVSPVVYKGDTIMYLVNGESCWTLYSVDKRMPIILAENKKCNTTSEELLANEAIAFWIEDIAEQVKYLRTSTDYDNQSESLEEWAQYDQRIVRAASDENNPDDYDWIIYETEEKGTETVVKDHLMATAWHQSAPFNTLSPLKSNSLTERCPAGCGAVAVAQYLYYMNSAKNMGLKMPTEGYCLGNYDNMELYFTNMQDTRTYEPALTDNYFLYTDAEFKLAALMIGYVGYELGTKYGDSGSSVTISDMRGYLAKLGLKTAYEDLDENQLYALRDFWCLPSILYAKNGNGVGHLWVCDGMKYTLEHYDEIWANISDSAYIANNYQLPAGTKMIRKSKQRRKNQLFLMNWGWNTQADPNQNDVDYTFWNVKDSWPAGLNKNRKMIYYLPLLQ